MMADDGMLINFDLGKGPAESKLQFKGGSWKDKLTARKAALYNRTKAEKRKNPAPETAQDVQKKSQDSSSTVPSERPLKKPRIGEQPIKNVAQARTNTVTGGEQKVTTRYDSNDRLLDSKAQRPTRPASSQIQRDSARLPTRPRQVISSLFSFNPTATSNVEASNLTKNQDDAPAEPSNAPLQDELSTFTSLGLSSRLAEHLLRKMEIKAPTAIQRDAVSQLIAEDSDAFIQAETGSGKTLAYLLPIVQRLAALSVTGQQRIGRETGLFAIILAPTRELSKQILVVLENLLRCVHWIVPGIVIGGESKKSEKARLRKGCNVLIATPGRLVDHLENTKILDVSKVRWLVLDEGDRLTELGFEKDIQKIVSILNVRKAHTDMIFGLQEKRTTVLCSATMKTDVQRLGEISLKDAVHIRTANATAVHGHEKGPTDIFTAPAQLQQSYIIVPAKLRLASLQALLKRSFLRKGSVMKAIVFMTCADSVDFHFSVFARPRPNEPDETSKSSKEAKDLDPTSICTSAFSHHLSSKLCSVQVFRLHGSLPQAIRTSTLLAYSRCKDPAVLICTDVASRGLDLPDIDFVIEYDPPFNKDEHLHRIGRTARAGKDGRATIFLMPGSEEGYIDILKGERRDGSRDIVRHDSADMLRKGFGSTGLGGGEDWEERATEWQLDVERWALENPQNLEQARKAYQSHVRAYATHVAAERHMFDMSALHLGHLAKAFALRDKPGSIRVPGLRPSKSGANNSRREKVDAGARPHVGGDDQVNAAVAQDAAKRMRDKIKSVSKAGASEYNIG